MLQGARLHPRRPGTSRPELRERPKPSAKRHRRASRSSQNTVSRQPPSHLTERHRQGAPFRAATQDLLHVPRQTGAGCRYRNDVPLRLSAQLGHRGRHGPVGPVGPVLGHRLSLRRLGGRLAFHSRTVQMKPCRDAPHP